MTIQPEIPSIGIATHTASSSGSRDCLICKERITDRTLVVNLVSDSGPTGQFTFHMICARDFAESIINHLTSRYNR